MKINLSVLDEHLNIDAAIVQIHLIQSEAILYFELEL